MSAGKIIVVFLLITSFLTSEALAVGSSANYKMTAEVIDAGAIAGAAASYRMLGKVRERALTTPSSTNFIIGEGFLRSVYFGPVILGPVVTGINPATGSNNQTVSVSISGANFVPGSTVKLSLAGEIDIAGTSVNVVSATRITCDFNLNGAKPGLWSVTVTVPDGRLGTLPSAFKITYPSPVVLAITPDKGYNNAFVNITNLSGNYFRSGAQVKLSKTGENDIAGDNIVVESASKITCRFNLSGKVVGLWDVVVTNDDNQSGTLVQSFKVESPDLEVIGPVINYPNPFNPLTETTTIKYTLSQDAAVTLYLYNMRGERI